MKNAKTLIAMLLALVMVLALCACGQTAAPVEDSSAAEAPAADTATDDAAAATDGEKVQTVLKCAFNQTIDNPEAQALLQMSDDLYDATEGRYSIEVYPDASLGSQAQTLEQVTMGALDMSLVANTEVENIVSDFSILSTPYVYDSLEHQQKLFQSDLLDELYASAEPYGFAILATYSLGARNVYTRDKAIETPADLAGMKIRVMNSPTCIAMMKAMGAEGVAMDQGDVYTAIQTGTIDGAENNINTYVDLVQNEVAIYYNYTGHLMIPDQLVIATDVLANMSEEDQAALKQVAYDNMTFFYDLINEVSAENTAKAAEELGVIFTECDVEAFRESCNALIDEVANRTDMTKAVYEAIVSTR